MVIFDHNIKAQTMIDTIKKYATFNITILVTVALIGLAIWYWYIAAIAAVALILIVGNYDLSQPKHTLGRTYPVIWRFRPIAEKHVTSKWNQYRESETSGRPIPRFKASLVYQRAKNERETVPFGTKEDLYKVGQEWTIHSNISAKPADMVGGDRFMIGSKDCTQPYDSSIINVSAMSFGALSKNAVMAIGAGAKQGNFAQNTGEGGISPYHLKYGNDLIFQIGTGYFGAGKTVDGVRYFDPAKFAVNANIPNVKMIEIKLSQGAKPGHGGILPAVKNTPEIAEIRGVEPGTQVESPGYHTAFNDIPGLIEFIMQIRELSGGKPVGLKLCIGFEKELDDMLRLFKEYDVYPDYIAVDGAEGGTGAAPLEHTNNIGTPLTDGILIASKLLDLYDLRSQIKLIVAGKILTAFDVVKMIALGADGIYVARGFMLSLGCIRALECNNDTCPVGITTHDPKLVQGLVVKDKLERVENYHRNTIHAVKEIVGGAALTEINQLDPTYIQRRVALNQTMNYAQIIETLTA